MRAPEDRLNSLQSKLDTVIERRKSRREKYEASDKKDADREKALRGDILRAEKTIEFNEQLDAELARLNVDHESATVSHDDDSQERDADGNLVFSH